MPSVYGTGAMLSLNLNFEQLAQIMAGTYQSQDKARRVRGEMATA